MPGHMHVALEGPRQGEFGCSLSAGTSPELSLFRHRDTPHDNSSGTCCALMLLGGLTRVV